MTSQTGFYPFNPKLECFLILVTVRGLLPSLSTFILLHTLNLASLYPCQQLFIGAIMTLVLNYISRFLTRINEWPNLSLCLKLGLHMRDFPL